MTSWLRLTLRCVRLLLVLTAALPVCGVVTAYGTALAYAAGPGTTPPSTGGRPAQPGPPARPGPGRPNHPGREHAVRPDPGRLHQGSLAAGAWTIPTPSGSGSVSGRPSRLSRPASEPSRAGSRAGEGRMRPGRPDGPAAQVEGDDDTGPTQASDTTAAQPEEPETADVPNGTPGASPPPEEAGLQPTRPPATQQSVQQGEAPTEPVLRILPLGSGLVLIGLGLALALLGLRLRRS